MEESLKNKKIIEYVCWGIGTLIAAAIIFFALLWFMGGKSPATVFKTVTVDEIITEFSKAGLEAQNPSDLPKKEFGNIREEGKRIIVPGLGENQGGRIYKFKSQKDLEKAKTYYDELGNSAPMLYSHTYAKGKFLLQMSGKMKDDEFNQYKVVMDKVVK